MLNAQVISSPENEIDTGGGPYLGGNVDTGSGDFIGGNKIIHNHFYAEDGQPIPNAETISPPSSRFDPSLLQRLQAPGGALLLRDTFYVTRPADDALKQEMIHPGTTTTLQAPRQTGRTSLLVRSIKYAQSEGAKSVFLDFQALEDSYFSTSSLFLRHLAEAISRELDLDADDEIERRWQRPGGDQSKLTYFLEDVVLPRCQEPLNLIMDEADHLLEKTDFYTDFFGLVRSWHNRRALCVELWGKLNIVLSISTEPYLLIRDLNQSPFNVGLRLTLEDFSMAQVTKLNEKHGSPVIEENVPRLQSLLGGHPYLTRLALYALVKGQTDWATLYNRATSELGLFGSHLRHQYALIQAQKELVAGLRQVIKTGKCNDEQALFRLQRSGLIHEGAEGYRCRCGLYQLYFEEKFG